MICSAVNRFRAILASFLNRNPSIQTGPVLGGKVTAADGNIDVVEVKVPVVKSEPDSESGNCLRAGPSSQFGR